MYQGEKNDVGERHGKGSYYYNNNFFVFEGNYVNGKKEGHGTLKFGDGGFYEGDFHDDQISGKGIRRYPDGSTYQGEFWMGERHGKGVLHKSDGSSYDGDWKLGKLDGKGEMKKTTDKSRVSYKGSFKEHKPHGKGDLKIQTESGENDDLVILKKGEFEMGQLHGSECCLEIIENEELINRYIGPFHNGKREGIGTSIFERIDTESNDISEEEKVMVCLNQCLYENDDCIEVPTNIFCEVVQPPIEEKSPSSSTPKRRKSSARDLKVPKNEEIDHDNNNEDQNEINKSDLIYELFLDNKSILTTFKIGTNTELPKIRCFLTSKYINKPKINESESSSSIEPINEEGKSTRPRKKSSSSSNKRSGRKRSKSRSRDPAKRKRSRSSSSKRRKSDVGGFLIDEYDFEIAENDPNLIILKRFEKESGRIVSCQLIKIKDEFIKPPKKKVIKKVTKKKGSKSGSGMKDDDDDEQSKIQKDPILWYQKYRPFVVEENIKTWNFKIHINSSDDDSEEEEELEGEDNDDNEKKKKKRRDDVLEIRDLPEDLSHGVYMLKFEDGCPQAVFKKNHVIHPFFMYFQVKKSGK